MYLANTISNLDFRLLVRARVAVQNAEITSSAGCENMKAPGAASREEQRRTVGGLGMVDLVYV
jgi:hypothetical protein